jgi:CubicO group peptidase (beta-lactamase class C family)
MAPSNTPFASLSTRVLVALSVLLPAAPLLRVQPIAPAFVDGYIRAGMQTGRLPGLALGVVQDDRVVSLKGYGIAGPDRRPASISNTPMRITTRWA